MRFEEPTGTRYKTSLDCGNLVISIPSQRKLVMILFLGAWLCGWAFGEVAVIGQLLGASMHFAEKTAASGVNKIDLPAVAFMIVWLCGWTFGGAIAIFAWVFQIKGMEEVVLGRTGITIAKKTPIWTYKKAYRFEEAKSFRIPVSHNSIFGTSQGMDAWGFVGGLLGFDYGAKTIRFGIGIEEAEARKILQEIKRHFPELIEGNA